jgi:hypothetical protein
MIVSSCYLLQHTYKHISKTLNVIVSKVFDEIPQPEKDFKDTQNHDDPSIMAWDHYTYQYHRCLEIVEEHPLKLLFQFPGGIKHLHI